MHKDTKRPTTSSILTVNTFESFIDLDRLGPELVGGFFEREAFLETGVSQASSLLRDYLSVQRKLSARERGGIQVLNK